MLLLESTRDIAAVSAAAVNNAFKNRRVNTARQHANTLCLAKLGCCSGEQEADTSTTGRRIGKSLGLVDFSAFAIARKPSSSQYMVCSGLRLAQDAWVIQLLGRYLRHNA
jgi:hypothetical protein